MQFIIDISVDDEKLRDETINNIKSMISDILEINDYVILIEKSNAEKTTIEKCELDGNIIGFAFYGSGDVELTITHNNRKKTIHNMKCPQYVGQLLDKVNKNFGFIE